MESWLLISIIVSAVLLFLMFLFVIRAKQQFYITQRILKPVLLNSKKNVFDLFKCEQTNNIVKNIKIGEGENYSFYPKSNTVMIEKNCLYSTSLYDLTATAHELGHAYATSRKSALASLWYVLKIFEKLFCWAIIPLFLAGIVLSFFPDLTLYGTILLNSSSAISIVILLGRIITISTEKEASKYGLWILNNTGFLNKNELKMSKKMLKIALSTYVFAFYERLFFNFIIFKKIIFKILGIKPKKSNMSLKSQEQVNELVNSITEYNNFVKQKALEDKQQKEEQQRILNEQQSQKSIKKVYDPNAPTMYDVIFKKANEQPEIIDPNKEEDIIKMPAKKE